MSTSIIRSYKTNQIVKVFSVILDKTVRKMHTFSKAFNSQFQLKGIYTNFNQLENSDSQNP